MTIKKTFLYFVILVAISCSNNYSASNIANTMDPAAYYEELNISYGADGNQNFDLYLPANRTPETKVLILIHGGGWSNGDKADMNPFKTLIRQELPNIAIVNINYRLADATNTPYPMQIEDITSVTEYLKSKESEYLISDQYGFIGVSAGAHLSMLWSYAFDSDRNSKMVCSIVGPTNFTDPSYTNNNNSNFQTLIKLYGLDASTTFLEEVSPLHQVTSSAPPSILFYGGKDPLIPTSQGLEMRDKLVELEVINEFTLYPDEGHGWSGLTLANTWLKLKLFIQANLN